MQSFRFSNLLGSTYSGGTVTFTPDGNHLLSPAGNRVNVVDLVQGKCITLEPENRENIAVLALSSDSRLLLSIDQAGHALLINFVRGAVLHRINFKAPVQSARWSPDSNMLAITLGKRLQLWRAPSLRLGWQFVNHRTLGGHHDDIVDLAWAPNSLFVATCSRDMSVRLWSVNEMAGFQWIALTEHRSPVRGVFFSADMHYLFSMSRDGVLVSLRYDLTDEETLREMESGTADKRPLYCRPGRWSVSAKAYCQQPPHTKVTRCAFDGTAKVLAVGFSSGLFMLYQMPELQTLQTLSLGKESLDAIALGAKGDWLAVGSAAVGQLLVWEWRSETYVLKQQGHHWGVQCVAFSPSGQMSLRHEKTLSTTDGQEKGNMLAGRMLATGGYDGKVKLFNSQSGLCFVTFAEHTAPVSALCFTPQGNAVLSASKDGSVRAYDLMRYRNFRTFVSPEGLCQFASVSVDGGGEIVAAAATGGKYAIYAWSIQTGNLLEVLTAHEDHVPDLCFSTSALHPGQLVTCSWDGTLRVWDLYAGSKGGAPHALQCPSSVTCVAFDPRGNNECAAACLSGAVLFWDVDNLEKRAEIDGLRDIRSGRQWHDRFSATHLKGNVKKGKATSENINFNQHFSCVAYARSGELLVCGSRNSPHICLYDTGSCTLAGRLTLTTNRSLGGVQTILSSKNMTETGAPWQDFDISDDEYADDREIARNQKHKRQASTLPGVHVGEAKDMHSERELHVWDVGFSSDSQQISAATTHGVFIFSVDVGLSTSAVVSSTFGGSAGGRFVPQMLTKRVSAPAVLRALDSGDLSRAMILALALNDYGLLRKVYEAVPVDSVPVIVASIGAPLLPALLWFLGLELRPGTGTPHFQFHMLWITAVIDLHFLTLLDMSTGKRTARTGASLEAAAASQADVAALCLQLLAELSHRHTGMAKAFDGNRYLLKYLGSAPTAEDADGHAGLDGVPTASSLPEAREEVAHGAGSDDAAGAGDADAVAEDSAGTPAGAAAPARAKKKRKAEGEGEALVGPDADKADAAEDEVDRGHKTRRRKKAGSSLKAAPKSA